MLTESPKTKLEMNWMNNIDIIAVVVINAVSTGLILFE